MTSPDPQPQLLRPPRLPVWMMAAVLPRRYRDEHLGDLEEGFLSRAKEGRHATRWYWSQVIRSLPGAIALRYQTRHDRNDSFRTTPMETIAQDLRYGLRAIWKNPGFAGIATLTLALAIGVNTSIFTLVNAIVFSDLPMQESESVALVRRTNTALEIERGSVSEGDYLDLLKRARSFESLAVVRDAQWVLRSGSQPVRVTGLNVSPNLTRTWRLPPALGRGFADGEDLLGAPPVVMLSHGFWQSQYGGRTNVLGETIRLDETEYTIIGVMSLKLEFADFATAQVLTPLILNRADPDRVNRNLFLSGRLAPSVTHEMATAELRRIGEDLANEHPAENRGWGLWSAPVRDSLIDRNAKTILLLLQLAVGMVILIACANVANLLLVRGTGRAKEFAVRRALGAGRPRLIRQLLTESVLISLGAAGLGLLFAKGINRTLIWVSGGAEQVFLMAKFDGRVLGFTLFIALVAPMVFGLFPALRASSSGPASVLRSGRSADGGKSGKRARAALVTAQISLALTLMIVASLVTRSVFNLQVRPLGFEAEDLLTVALSVSEASYGEAEARVRFFDQISEELGGVAGLGPVELTSVIAAAGAGTRRPVVIEGREVVEGVAAPSALYVTASTGYLDLIGLPILQGRGFTAADNGGSFDVAILSKTVADDLWPDEDPLGRRFQAGVESEWIRVVGVVRDVRGLTGFQWSASNIYRPQAQVAQANMFMVSRTTADQGRLAGLIREAVWKIDPNQPVDEIQWMERVQYLASAGNLAITTLFLTFAIIALFMAGIGIYGVMAYSVSQRKSEIGLRMALGAQVGGVRWMVISQGARLLVIGIAIGLMASYGIGRLLQSILFELSATDPLTFVGVPLILAVVALLANSVPAYRATRTDPAQTLRGDT